MRYEILGPVRVVDDAGRGSLISARKIEAVLVRLLIEADNVVSAGRLKSEIWEGRSPRQDRAALYVYISKLRSFLTRRGGARERIITHSPGYLLRLGDDEFDLNEFQHLMDTARGHRREQRHDGVVECCERGLALWRGPVAGNLHQGPAVRSFAARLADERLECLEMLIESRMALGHHREVIGRLYSLVADHPLCEVFYRQLMLALYRSDRQNDALRVYGRAREVIKGELGLEPCPSLRDLQNAILASDQGLYAYSGT